MAPALSSPPWPLKNQMTNDGLFVCTPRRTTPDETVVPSAPLLFAACLSPPPPPPTARATDHHRQVLISRRTTRAPPPRFFLAASLSPPPPDRTRDRRQVLIAAHDPDGAAAVAAGDAFAAGLFVAPPPTAVPFFFVARKTRLSSRVTLRRAPRHRSGASLPRALALLVVTPSRPGAACSVARYEPRAASAAGTGGVTGAIVGGGPRWVAGTDEPEFRFARSK